VMAGGAPSILAENQPFFLSLQPPTLPLHPNSGIFLVNDLILKNHGRN
jgi:hypothetical protein